MSTATLWGKVLSEDSIEVIKKLGINIAEAFLTTFSEYEAGFGDILASRKGDMRIFSVHTLNIQFEPELVNSVPRTRDDADVWFRKALLTGQKLGATSYTFHGTARLKRKPYSIDYPVFGEKVNRIIEIAAEYGITLSYDNVDWTLFSSPDFIENIKKYSPKLKTTLDIKQAMQSGLSYSDYIPSMADTLNNVHISDFDDNGNIVAPRCGNVDFYDLFSRLFDIGYNGPLMLELYPQSFKENSD